MRGETKSILFFIFTDIYDIKPLFKTVYEYEIHEIDALMELASTC